MSRSIKFATVPDNFLPFCMSVETDKFFYILRLTDDKWYVGYTENIHSRMKSHFSGKGAKWTQQFHPLDITAIFLFPNLPLDDVKQIENEITLEMMKLFGVDNVRGGDWCKTTTSDPYGDTLNGQINTIEYNHLYRVESLFPFLHEPPELIYELVFH